jgi:transposase-like protein
LKYSPTQKAAILARAEKLLAQPGATQRSVAPKLGISQPTLCEWMKSSKGHDAGGAPEVPAGVEQQGDEAIIASKPTNSAPEANAVTAEALLTKHGFDPADWVITSIRVSEWGNPEAPMFQLRINATRRNAMLIIPDLSDFEPWEYGQVEEYAPHRVALIPDLHAPFHDEAALRAVCDLLVCEQPERVVFLGDVADNSFLSKHRTHRRFKSYLNETNDAVVKNFRRVREAVPDAQIDLLPGNHDDRVLYYAQDLAPEFEGARPGKWDGEEPEPAPALGFERLWHLDKLGINLVDEDWKLAQLAITPELSARHGYLTGNNSERKLLEKHGRSQVHGHDHRGSLVYRTKHDPLDIRVAMSCGTLSEVKPDGLGYEPDPDWTPGMGWVQVWDDGMFQLSFFPFIKNKLLTPWGAAFEGQEV